MKQKQKLKYQLFFKDPIGSSIKISKKKSKCFMGDYNKYVKCLTYSNDQKKIFISFS